MQPVIPPYNGMKYAGSTGKGWKSVGQVREDRHHAFAAPITMKMGGGRDARDPRERRRRPSPLAPRNFQNSQEVLCVAVPIASPG
jgi:hypothetical protein